AVHAGLGEDEQQLVVQPDGLIELLMNLAPALDVVRRKPAADTSVLQIGVEPVGKLLVMGRIADEAGVELDRACAHTANEVDELVRHAAAAQKELGNLAVRLVDGVDTNR